MGPGLAHSQCRIEHSLQHDHGTKLLRPTTGRNMLQSGIHVHIGAPNGCRHQDWQMPAGLVASTVNICKLHHTVQHAGAPATISNDEQDHIAALRQKYSIDLANCEPTSMYTPSG